MKPWQATPSRSGRWMSGIGLRCFAGLAGANSRLLSTWRAAMSALPAALGSILDAASITGSTLRMLTEQWFEHVAHVLR